VVGYAGSVPQECAFGLVFFFFQAEDGIRDLTVTGVQTCALPISRWRTSTRCAGRWASRSATVSAVEKKRRRGPSAAAHARTAPRSEERRVGKECRCWVAAQGQKKKREDASVGGEGPGGSVGNDDQ